MPVSTALSANIEVGGRRVPLSSQPIDRLADGASEKVEAIKAKIAAGTTFALSPGTDISVSLQDIVAWIGGAADDFKLPPEVKEIFASGQTLENMSITITAFSVNTAGAFHIALAFDFGPDGLAEKLGVPHSVANWLNFDDVGLAFSYKMTA